MYNVEPTLDQRRNAIWEEGDSTQAVVVESELEPSKDLLVSTFSLKAGDSTPAAAAAQVVEEEPSEDLAKPGPLEYIVDPLEDLMTTSTNYRPEDENDTVRMCAIIGIYKEYPTDQHLFCDTPVTPDLERALFEFGPCQAGLKDYFDSFPKDEDGRHFSPTWYKKNMENSCEINRHWLVYSPRENTMICIPCWLLKIGRIVGVIQKLVARFFSRGRHKIEKHEKKLKSQASRELIFPYQISFAQ